MVKRLDEELNVVIKFGGGLHTRASADEIDPREAADGQNFIIDLENRNLRNRPPFDLIGTVPNTSEIRGGGSLLKADGTAAPSWIALTSSPDLGTLDVGARKTIDLAINPTASVSEGNYTFKLRVSSAQISATRRGWAIRSQISDPTSPRPK